MEFVSEAMGSYKCYFEIVENRQLSMIEESDDRGDESGGVDFVIIKYSNFHLSSICRSCQN